MENVLLTAPRIARNAYAVFSLVLNILAGILVVVLCLWMAMGIANLVLELFAYSRQDWAKSAEHTIGNALLILAMFELIRTLQSYVQLGRVRVTFILDTALVVLIGELMGLWFKDHSLEKVFLVLLVVAVLVGLRIITTRFSPELAE